MKSWNPALAGCALAMAMVFTNPVDAQWEGGRGPRERPSAEEIEKRRQEARTRLFDALKLDDAQMQLVDSLLTVRDEKIMAMVELMRSSFGDREMMREMRGEMQDQQADTEKQIAAALTEEQRELYKAYRDKEQENRGWGRRQRGDQATGDGGDSGGDSDAEDGDDGEGEDSGDSGF
ncbi:MAG: hypothetical protein VYD18_13135 [Candidatus Latescibacterota bacterium]|nr:hypothetical protein [Candidatus Latescibacterota bacterium]